MISDITPSTFCFDLDEENCENNLSNFLAFYFQHCPFKLAQKMINEKKNTIHLKKKQKYYSSSQPVDKKNTSKYSKPKMFNSFISNENESNYLWLLKPTGLNRGRGIHVFSTIE